MQWLSEWVSESVSDSFRFGDSCCISELCELVYFPIWRNSAASAQLMELNVIDATQQNSCNSCTRHNTSSLKYHPLSVKVWKFYKSNHTSLLSVVWWIFEESLLTSPPPNWTTTPLCCKTSRHCLLQLSHLIKFQFSLKFSTQATRRTVIWNSWRYKKFQFSSNQVLSFWTDKSIKSFSSQVPN